MTDHLTPMVSKRGFQHMENIPSTYGGSIRVYESSAAMHPHIWVLVQEPEDLNNRKSPLKDAAVHLKIEDAIRLKEQLEYLIDNHYQNEAE